jgi:PHP domain
MEAFMNKEISQLIEDLNHHDLSIRLNSLKKLMAKVEGGEIETPPKGRDVNNHIHTTYSFSPYSPTKAIWMAYNAGLATAGIMDHDSISGAQEFIEAGRIVGIATTIGLECRVDFSKTTLNGRQFNNPDQKSIAYMAIHGIPHTQIAKIKEFFKPLVSYRNIRNQQMVTEINKFITPFGIEINFEKDVIPVSNFSEGGSVTERHILYALSLKLIQSYHQGTALVSFLKQQLKLNISAKMETLLTDTTNPYYVYDLLGLLKSELVSSFYINATKECPDVKDVISFAKDIGAISAYPYLGDIGDSVTGDKKTQKFEDDYLDLLFTVIKELKFNAVTYMPSRNSITQLERLRILCEQYEFFQICGEDINTPRQPFICQALRNGKFLNLFEATWALIGHELVATEQLERGMFAESVVHQYPKLQERIKIYQEIGLQSISNVQRKS